MSTSYKYKKFDYQNRQKSVPISKDEFRKLLENYREMSIMIIPVGTHVRYRSAKLDPESHEVLRDDRKKAIITYKRGAKQHPFIKPLLPAAINSINFDFTPTGNYTQLSNFDATDQATTVGVVITMQVTEVTNLFSDTLFNNPAPGVS